MRDGIEIDGRERTYVVVGDVEAPAGRALVLVFHGSRQTGEVHRRFTGGQFDGLTDRGAVVAYLDGYRGNWNDARRASSFPARREGIDDVAFVDAVIARLAGSHGIDPDRVFAIGFSNGGQMVLRLLAEPAARLAGGAVVAATLPGPDDFLLPLSAPARAVPVALVHGTDDPISPYRGGTFAWWARLLFRVGGRMRSFPDTAEALARRNGIEGAPATTSLGAAADGTRLEYTRYEAPGRPPVLALTVHGGGHTVPGPIAGPRLVGRTAASITVADLAADLFGLRRGPIRAGGRHPSR